MVQQKLFVAWQVLSIVKAMLGAHMANSASSSSQSQETQPQPVHDDFYCCVSNCRNQTVRSFECLAPHHRAEDQHKHEYTCAMHFVHVSRNFNGELEVLNDLHHHPTSGDVFELRWCVDCALWNSETHFEDAMDAITQKIGAHAKRAATRNALHQRARHQDARTELCAAEWTRVCLEHTFAELDRLRESKEYVQCVFAEKIVQEEVIVDRFYQTFRDDLALNGVSLEAIKRVFEDGDKAHPDYSTIVKAELEAGIKISSWLQSLLPN